MEQSNITSRVPVRLTRTDWNSIITILQVQATHEHRRGNGEMADEIRLLVDRIAIQL